MKLDVIKIKTLEDLYFGTVDMYVEGDVIEMMKAGFKTNADSEVYLPKDFICGLNKKDSNLIIGGKTYLVELSPDKYNKVKI